MTHDELLAKFTDYEAHFDQVRDEERLYRILHAVVELHKPCDHDDSESPELVGVPCICDYCFDTEYPCPTIQAIEKEL